MALENSLNSFGDQNFNRDHQLNSELIAYEPLNPEQRQRNDYEPVGLKNIGNSKCRSENHYV